MNGFSVNVKICTNCIILYIDKAKKPLYNKDIEDKDIEDLLKNSVKEERKIESF